MKSTYVILLFTIFYGATYAQSLTVEKFVNDREGNSIYIKKADQKQIKRWKSQQGETLAKDLFAESLKTFNLSNICAQSLVSILDAKAKSLGIKTRTLLLVLREDNIIDDIVLNTLLKNLKALEFKISIRENIEIPALDLDTSVTFMDFEKSKNRCIDETYRIWNSKTKLLENQNRENYIYAAYHYKVINFPTFQKLYRAHYAELDNEYVSLREYLSKKENLRTLFPIDPKGKNILINAKAKQERIGHRTRLYQRYSVVQITILAKVITNLELHLNSGKATINTYDKSGLIVVETRELTEMERFRYAIRALQTELTTMANNPLVGMTPTYLDVIAAAYEIGKVNSEQVTAIAKLEELWTPKKTFTEKYGTYIRLVGTVGTLLIPPPYGLVIALGLVAMESTAKKSEKISAPEHSLF